MIHNMLTINNANNNYPAYHGQPVSCVSTSYVFYLLCLQQLNKLNQARQIACYVIPSQYRQCTVTFVNNPNESRFSYTLQWCGRVALATFKITSIKTDNTVSVNMSHEAISVNLPGVKAVYRQAFADMLLVLLIIAVVISVCIIFLLRKKSAN